MNEHHPPVQLIKPLRTARFFTVPTLGTTLDTTRLNAYFNQKENKKPISSQGEITMRYAAYIRVSHEEQVNGYSLDAQRRALTEWVASKGGVLTRIYSDEGESATTANRAEFQRMRLDARNGKFDALVVHKFDRFARNRTDSLAIKSLLRYDYKIKVFSATEPSEDSDGPIGALIEGIMECVADWYSRNLSAETAKGKRERSLQGIHNNRPPFGYMKDESKMLIPCPEEVEGLQLAFNQYAQGFNSDADIAQLLNASGYRTKNKRPFSKETVREMLQNRTYLGKVRYQHHDKKSIRKNRANIPDECFFEGQHEALIAEELFEKCLEIRHQRASHRQATATYNPYILRNMVYCYRCCQNAPTDYSFPAYGKMRAQAQKSIHRYYVCRAKDFGRICDQKSVKCETIEEQVINALKHLVPTIHWRDRIKTVMGSILGEQMLEDRLKDINEAIDRMDFRWDQGFITDKLDYLEKRVKLQQELETLTPIPEDDLEHAADILKNFTHHWDACGNDIEEQHKLLSLIIERVYVEDKRVVALTLKADYHVVLGHHTDEPIVSIGSSVYTCGDDGIRTRGLNLDRVAC